MKLTDAELEQAKARGWRLGEYSSHTFAWWAESGTKLAREHAWLIENGPDDTARHELLTKPVEKIREALRMAEGAQ